MTAEQGKFVVFEGNDGAGKSTIAGRLAEHLEAQGIGVVLTKEPGGIPETVPVRKLILDERIAEDGVAQLLLFAADRRAHLLLQIVPSLQSGRLVVSDRYYGSTRIYQEERGVGTQDILWAENLAITFDRERVEPGVTILLDVDSEAGMARKQNQGGQNYFDKDKVERQTRRRLAYLELAHMKGWKVINTTGKGVDRVFEEALAILEEQGILPKRNL